MPITPELGGATSRVIATDKAYTYMAANAPADGSAPSSSAIALFNTNWVEYPASVKILRRARADLQPQLLLRLPRPRRPRPSAGSRRRADGVDADPAVPGRRTAAVPHPAYGDQLNDRAIPAFRAEGRAIIDYDGCAAPTATARPTRSRDRATASPTSPTVRSTAPCVSPRVAPAVIGLGLLEAVPLATLQALADPDDADGDGISGRINWLRPTASRAGRFGWKANVVTPPRAGGGRRAWRHRHHLEPLPGQNCPPAQTACAAAPTRRSSRSCPTTSSTGW